VISKAGRFKSVRNGGARRDEKDQDGISSGLRGLERPLATNRWLKVYPDDSVSINLLSERTE
jgi:hypothetical protein